jgi:hypothetical protein
MMIRAFLALTAITSIVLFIVPNLLDAQWSPAAVAAMLLGLVFFFALSTWTGWSYLEAIIKGGLAIGPALLFVYKYSGGNAAMALQIGTAVLGLIFALFGFFLIVTGGRSK